jgi:hypothetical protein
MMPSGMYHGYNDNPVGMSVLLIIGMVVPVFLIILRLVARKVERVDWWWDDYLAIISSVCRKFL